MSEPCQNDAVTRNFYTTNSAIAITFPQFLVIRLQMSECLLQVRVEHQPNIDFNLKYKILVVTRGHPPSSSLMSVGRHETQSRVSAAELFNDSIISKL